MKLVYVHAFDTELGTIRSAATGDGLALLHLPGGSADAFDRAVARRFPESETALGGPMNERAEAEIRAYLRGQLRAFTLPLDLRETEFVGRVLHEVAAIPYGQTKTYGEIAVAVGSPKAARAVGMANARNCVPLVIPCHRVVASSGLGGYGGGLEMKQWLLRLEGALGARLESLEVAQEHHR